VPHADITKLVADLTSELEAADIIIQQYVALLREHHIHESFTNRRATRRKLIAAAKHEGGDRV